MSRLPPLLITIAALSSSSASAQTGQQIPAPEAPGVTIFLEPGTLADPEPRVVAARRAMAAQKGRAIDNAPAKTSNEGNIRLAVLSERFQGEPRVVHGWMASSNSGAMCHLIAPATPQALQGVRPALERCAKLLLSGGGGASAGTTTAPSSPPATAAASPADLKRALDVVPRANRPARIVLRSVMRFNGALAYPSFEPWMLFANGWSTACTDWDAATIAPTPQALAPFKCKMLRWRKAGAGHAFETEPGKWEDEGPSNLTQFTPGQRIDVDLVNKSGFGSPIGAPGLAVSSLNSGQLQMSSDGRIAVGSLTSVVVSGASVGGGSTRRRGPAVGSYHLDGHMIAIADAQGGIRRGFIAEDKGKGGPYVYLNGDLFWPKRQR